MSNHTLQKKLFSPENEPRAVSKEESDLMNYSSIIGEEQSPRRVAALQQNEDASSSPEVIHILPEIQPLSPFDRQVAGLSNNDNSNDEQGGRDNYSSARVDEREEVKQAQQEDDDVFPTARVIKQEGNVLLEEDTLKPAMQRSETIDDSEFSDIVIQEFSA